MKDQNSLSSSRATSLLTGMIGHIRQAVVSVPAGYLLTVAWLLVWAKFVENLLPEQAEIAPKLTSTTLFVLAVIWLLFYAPNPAACSSGARRATWLIPLLTGAALIQSLQTLVYWFERFGYHVSRWQIPAVAALFLALACGGWFFARRPRSERTSLIFLALGSGALLLTWLIAVRQFPLDGDRSDMLPAMVVSIQSWLSGGPLYGWHEVGTHKAPLVYLPALWLPYVPLVALRLDPRWLTLPVHFAFVLVQWLIVRRSSLSHWWPYLLWMALNPFIVARHDLHIYPLWLLVSLAGLLMLRRSWLPAAMISGLLIAARHTLWIPFPFILAYLLIHGGWRKAAAFAVVSGGIGLGLLAAFALPDVPAFVYGVFGYTHTVVTDIATAPWERVSGWLSGFSLVPILYAAGLTKYCQLLQAVTVSALLLLTLVRRLDFAATLRMASLALMAFLLLNPLIEPYMYGELLILALVAVLADPARGLRQAR